MKVAATEIVPAPTETERAPAARQIAAIDVGSTSICGPAGLPAGKGASGVDAEKTAID